MLTLSVYQWLRGIEVQELSMLINQNLEFNPFSILFQKIVT